MAQKSPHTAEDQAKRHWLMQYWREEMTRQLASPNWADFDDPVALILVLDDDFGRPIAEAIGNKNGVSIEQIERVVAECKRTGDYPTLRLVSPAEEVRKVLQFTAETAQANFDNLNKKRRPGLDYFYIVIGYNGNSYGLLQVPNRAPNLARDGQNRMRKA